MDRYNQATSVALKKGIKDAVAGAGAYTINNYLDLSASVLILFYGGHLVMEHDERLTAGKLISYQLYWNLINSSYQQLVNIVTSFTRAAGAAQRVFSLLDQVADIDIDAGTPLQHTGKPVSIAFDKVRFSYQMRPDWEVLRGINLTVKAGATLAIVGKSGSGKSTMLSLLLRFYDPQQGRILIDGQPLTDIQLRSFHDQAAIVAQDTQLFGCSVYENITYGLDEDSYTYDDVISVAKKACAHEFITAFPEGYMTRVGERGARLSGGQKQRVAIARALLRKPKLLLLDEATSALDAESEASVQKALDQLMQQGVGGTTIVLVAHRLSTVVGADSIAVMHDGQIVEVGTHRELLKVSLTLFTLHTNVSAVVMHVRLQQIGGVYAKLVGKQLARQANILPESGAAAVDADDVDAILDSIEKENGSSSIVNNGTSTDDNDNTSNSTNERAPRPLPQQSSNEPPRRVRFVGEVGGRGFRSGGGGGGGGGHRGRAV
eukprot:14118-Heterococcus_DN1.PRE.1